MSDTELARNTLCNAQSAELLVDGLGRLGTPVEAVLHERDGQPTFYCMAGSPLATAAAAHASAVLTTTCGSASAIFFGNLALTGQEHVDGVPVDVIALRLASIMLERDDPEAASVVQRAIPLEQYGGARLALEEAASVLRTHLNSEHGSELRAFIARQEQASEDSIASAAITALDAGGIEVSWIDEGGAQRARMRFAGPARCPRELARLVRAQLVDGC